MNPENLPDEEILRLISEKGKNSERAFRFVYKKNASRLMAYCKSMIKDHHAAEDIFQETFIRFYKKASSENPGCSVTGFLFIIARNLCLDHFRNKRYEVPLQDYHYNIGDEISDGDIKEQKINLILSSMEMMNEEDKELLIMRSYNKLSYREIGEILRTSEPNARKRVFRAKMRLKKIIEPYHNMFEK